MRDTREGLLSSALFSSVLGAGLWLLFSGYIQLSAIVFFILILQLFKIVTSLENYRYELEGRVRSLRLSQTPQWIDINATHDLVPMGAGSFLESQRFVKPLKISNERSFLHDHVSYFRNRAGFLVVAWRHLAELSKLPLFDKNQSQRLDRYVKLHAWHTRVLSLSWHSTWLAPLVAVFVLRKNLDEFGAAAREMFKSLPFGNELMQSRFLSVVITSVEWLFQRSEDSFWAEVLGFLILVGGLVLWRVGFKGLWRARADARWRSACRGTDVLNTKGSWVKCVVGCTLFLLLGSLPCLFLLSVKLAPGLTNPIIAADFIRAVVSLACFVIGVFLSQPCPGFTSSLGIQFHLYPSLWFLRNLQGRSTRLP
jgi:hypothetical protein